MKFPISREARDRYQFDPELFSPPGTVGTTGFHAARAFTQRMNERRDLVRFPEQAVNAGEVNALALIDEIFRLVIDVYCEQKSPTLRAAVLDSLIQRHGREVVDRTLIRFLDAFPPAAVYYGKMDTAEYLNGT